VSHTEINPDEEKVIIVKSVPGDGPGGVCGFFRKCGPGVFALRTADRKKLPVELVQDEAGQEIKPQGCSAEVNITGVAALNLGGTKIVVAKMETHKGRLFSAIRRV
jgi:hypothetical protein